MDKQDPGLDERVRAFSLMQLPGQSPMMHMGTAYLVNDLHKEVKRLRALFPQLRQAALMADWHEFDALIESGK